MSRSFGKESSSFWSFSLSPRGLRIEDVRQYLDEGGDVNRRDEHQKTLLHIAADNGEVEIVRLLLARGADINARGYRNYTALHFAVDMDCCALTQNEGCAAELPVAKVLIDAGADESARDNDREIPRDTAVAYGKKLVALYDAISKLPEHKTDRT